MQADPTAESGGLILLGETSEDFKKLLGQARAPAMTDNAGVSKAAGVEPLGVLSTPAPTLICTTMTAFCHSVPCGRNAANEEPGPGWPFGWRG
jgi:hypothetical protein